MKGAEWEWFELSLGHELDIDRRRFDSEWLFQWYNILSEGRIVDVPSFDGGRIARGGCEFDDQCQSIYWQAIGRYLNGKVHEIFRRWDQETSTYPADQRRSSLDGTARLLGQFVAGVMERANTTDQALRGRGTPRTDKTLEGSGVHSFANVEILRLTQAHMALMPAETSNGQTVLVRFRKRLEDFYANNKGLIWLAGGFVSGGGLLLKYITG
jgi:hypothetical protein